MESLTAVLPFVLGVLGTTLGFGILSLLLGIAPFIVLIFFGASETLPLTLGLLGTGLILTFFSALRKNVDWADFFRLGLFVFLGAGLSFYFTWEFYFRYSSFFLFAAMLIWLGALPFLPRTVPDRQFTFFPIFSNLVHGLLAGLTVGALGFAGFPLLVPFLQIFRKMDRSRAVSTSVPLGVVSLFALGLVLSIPRTGFGAFFTARFVDDQLYVKVFLLSIVGLLGGLSVGRRLLSSLSPFLVSLIQFLFIVTTLTWSWWHGKSVLPCFSRNPLSCIQCFQKGSEPLGWELFLSKATDLGKDPTVSVVINSCGQPLGIHHTETQRTDLIIELPGKDLTVGIQQASGAYSEAWEGLRIKRIRKQRAYFDRAGCAGNAALSRRKLETRVGTTTILNQSEYWDVREALSAFWYASYRDGEGECVNQSGMIKASKDMGVYALNSKDKAQLPGEPLTDENCCHKFLQKESFASTLYFSDESCSSAAMATDDDGPNGIERSVLFHQGKYYRIKDQLPEFEYHSYLASGKECVKQDGLLSPLSERQGFVIEEIQQPRNFSDRLPLSIRSLHARDLRFWL